MGLEADSLAACTEELKHIGFRRKRLGVYIQARAETGVKGWLGLNTMSAGLPGEFGVNPVVGVWHSRLEDALLEVATALPKPPIPAASKPLGYLMPEQRFRMWTFSQGGGVNNTAADLVTAVFRYGQDFIDQYSNWETYSILVQAGDLIPDHLKLIIRPLVCALNGYKDEAFSLVMAESARISEEKDMYSISYQEFAKSFSVWCHRV